MSIDDCNILNNVNNAWICSFLGAIKKLTRAIIIATCSVAKA